ncbi:hypothetical protein ABB37_06897 [Leptomonas pyrrhocoris]|uniref:CHASE domain-containing protein n=1 Tax=Leptomonas pyrrhocoris TaxID=157538 RepID=A0A0N0DTH8_LEPPY|nr:hypothetical protein ABB37_06897 [Leptomonas pyrrhocoris]KPA77512.1 hypothetical protein ABB37_06897 [Leptomonas pyrrhocoris]|eukprot:XP_015655951.1 hypothetical protein ABB37_06897 [Leptomonas pyrrhocoris]
MKILQNSTGYFAEDEQNNTRHARRYRVYLIILAVWVALLVILAAVLTPMLVLQHQDNNAEKASREAENELAGNLTTEFRDAVLNAISAVYGIQGFIMGEMKTLPNITGTKKERVTGQFFANFFRYANLVNSSAASMAVFLTAPGGVTYQFFPSEYGILLRNWDLLDEDMYGPSGTWYDPAAQRPSPWDSIQTGRLAISGPYMTSRLPFVESKARPRNTTSGTSHPTKTWWVDFRQPVYQPNAHATVSISNFWGFAMAALNVDNLLEDNDFEKKMRANSMNYTVFTSTKSQDCITIVSSWPDEPDCSVPFIRNFINTASVHDVLGDQLAWKVAVKSAVRENRLTEHVRVAIVLSSVFGTVLIFTIMVYIIVLCTRVYDGTVHAPKGAPFAMLTVGLCRGEELWELASDQMVEVKERLVKVLARQMQRHHAYQIQQVHPLTQSFVTHSVSAAVQMAFDVIEELQSNPIDGVLQRLLGDDGHLLLSYAVHWCNDAVVRPEHLEGGYRYEGPDVVYGGRMWVFAAPNVVTVSPAALHAATHIPHVQCKLFDSVFLRGVAERQDLYVLSDPTNHRLSEAEVFAVEQVRRARQAQREIAEMKNSDADPHKRRLTRSSNQSGYDSSDLDVGSFAGRPRLTGTVGGGEGNWATSSAHSNPASNSDPCSPSSPLRCRAAAAAAAKTGKREGAIGVTAVNPTSVLVPSSSAEAATNPFVYVSDTTAAAAAAVVVLEKPQERRLVRRPSGHGDTSSSDEDKMSSATASTVHDDDYNELGVADKITVGLVGNRGDRTGLPRQKPATQTARVPTVPYATHIPVPPALPPISPAYRPVAYTAADAAAEEEETPQQTPLPGMRSRRALDTLYTGVGGEANAGKPLVVVPPSAKLAGETAASGDRGATSRSSSSTPSSDGVVGHGRRGNVGPASSYDNPLAHNLAAGATATAAAAAVHAAAQDGAPLDSCAPAASALRGATVPIASDGDPLADSEVSLDTFSSDLLLRPAITVQADHLLRTVFDRQAVALDVSYDSVRVLVYYFYSSYKILFRPLAAPERHNIYRRLVTAFGVPQQGILEHLAARCAIRFLQRHDETQTLLWDQQRRLQAHARAASVPTATTSTSVSDDAGGDSSN